MIPFRSWISAWPVRRGGNAGKMGSSSGRLSVTRVAVGDLLISSWRPDPEFHELKDPGKESECAVGMLAALISMGQ